MRRYMRRVENPLFLFSKSATWGEVSVGRRHVCPIKYALRENTITSWGRDPENQGVVRGVFGP